MAGNRGRQFERLVEMLELMAATDARVEFDARLPDRHTGRLRQVDVAVYIPSHHGDLLYAIEAKDHSRPVGVGVIESAVTKRNDIGAARYAIVSRVGFTQTAREKAEKEKIDLLTTASLERGEWPDWMVASSLGVLARRWSIRGVTILGRPQGELLGRFSVAEPILSDSDGNPVTADALTRVWVNAGGADILADLARSEHRASDFTLNFEPAWTVHPSLDPNEPTVNGALLTLEYWNEERPIPMKYVSYRSGHGEEIVGAFVTDPVDLGQGSTRIAIEQIAVGNGSFRIAIRMHPAQ